MARRADDSFLRGDGGGPVPRHDELEIDGPFLGFQTDSDAFHKSPPQLARDIRNLDILEGNLTLRPGTRELFDPVTDISISNETYRPASQNRIYDGVSEPSGDVSTESKWTFFIWMAYNFAFRDDIDRFGTPPGTGIGSWLTANSQIGSLFDGDDDITTVGPTVFTGVGVDDAVSGGVYTGDNSDTYTVTISLVGPPDQFDVKKGAATIQTGVQITFDTPQLLSDGVTITFSQSYDHVLTDFWTIAVTVTGSLVDTTLLPGGITQVDLVSGTPQWECIRLVGNNSNDPLTNSYFHVEGEASGEWRRIISVSATTLILQGTLAIDHLSTQYRIAIPLVDLSITSYSPGDSVATDATKIPLTDPAQYYISGWAGGHFFGTGMDQGEPYQLIDDPIKYVANASIIYAGRLLIATDIGYDKNLAAPSQPGVNTGNITQVLHPGRIAWTRTNEIRSFDFSPVTGGDPTAGFIDDIGVAIGRIYDLFEMRGVVYALSERGIAAINTTGNAYDPFRIRVLVNNKLITPRSKAQVIDGKFAVFLTTDGVYLFDGASIDPVSLPINEYYRGTFGIQNSDDPATKGSMYYDDVRNRVYVFTDNDNQDFLVYDTDGQYWLRHNVTMEEGLGHVSKRFAGGLNWVNTTGPTDDERQDVEMLIIGRGVLGSQVDKLYSYERGLTTDNLENYGWHWDSPTIDFQESRSDKTIVRFRTVINDTDGPSAQTVTIEWFVDGGITPKVTKTFDIGNNAVAGAEYTKFVTFPGITWTSFRYRLSGTEGKPIIKEMAVTLKRRLEKRQT